MGKNLTQACFLVAIISMVFPSITVAEPIPWWWNIVGFMVFVGALGGSIATIIYGVFEMIKFKRNKKQSLIFIMVLSFLWLWTLGSILLLD